MAVNEIAAEMFGELARAFPVCSASDEFHFFPQALPDYKQRCSWDDFSPSAVNQLVGTLNISIKDLDGIADAVDRETNTDITTLKRIARTICEQLTEVRPQYTQPTFLLTVACIGLAEALESEEPDIWESRLRSLPDFLDQAGENLGNMPELFRDMGLEMLADTREWIYTLACERQGLDPVITSLDRLEYSIRNSSTCKNFLLPAEIYHRIIHDHIGCGMSPEEACQVIDFEIEENLKVLDKEGSRLDPGKNWNEVLEKITLPDMPKEGIIELYRKEVERLGRHCLEHGLISEEMFRSSPVRVASLPSYLSTIRSAAAYSMPPGHPPRGGTFFIIDNNIPKNLLETYQRQYRMLAAHETFPGHHLLDTCRWSLNNRVRRYAEFPLFYEGWACFAEELLFHTGYFSDSYDRMLLAARHLGRAIRGKLDIGLQTGRMDLTSAAKYLADNGWGSKQALSAARKYVLKPGYQLCYTIGLRGMRNLFEKYGKDNPRQFACNVLQQGEIDFDNLEKAL